SGLGALAQKIEPLGVVSYSDIEGLAVSTVQGHQGRFIYGRLGGHYVVAMQGRVHYYEGYTMEQVVLPIRVLCALGIKTLIVSNAAGGLNEEFCAGDLMVIEDHINLLPNPLVGPNVEPMGVRFPSLTGVYDRSLVALALDVAHGQGLELRRGVYVAWSGPSYETPAECRFLRGIGADAVGMSTTGEVIVAAHCGVRVFGISLISNVAMGPGATVATHEEVQQVAERSSERMSALIDKMVERL
ncbi:MAG: purine-nucleoside phosphorylase, partial [Mucinivorans sp.]